MSLENRPSIPQEEKSPERLSYAGRLRTIDDINVKGAIVWLRAGLDVEESEAENSERVNATAREIKNLFLHGAEKVRVFAHIGEGDRSTQFLVPVLSNRLQLPVGFNESIEEIGNGDHKVELYQNIRRWPGEKGKDPQFAKALARLGNVYVNNAFDTSQRDHTSMTGVPRLLPSACGSKVVEEIDEIEKVLSRPSDGFFVVMGGAKVSDKAKAIRNLSKIAETVVVGGLLPKEIKEQGYTFDENVLIANFDPTGKDIDRNSSERFVNGIRRAKIIVGNGAMGKFEDGFLAGSSDVYGAVASATKGGAYSLLGGGDTEKMLRMLGIMEDISHVCTGGGALLVVLGGEPLPALEVLRK